MKILGKGASQFKALGMPITLEVSDATVGAVEVVKECGGEVKVEHRTPLILRRQVKPHKYGDYKEFKVPMPSPKKLLKLEKLKEKGITVSYPPAPWYTDNLEKINADAEEKEKRIKEGKFAELLEKLPSEREEGRLKDVPIIEREHYPRVIKYGI